MSGRPAKKFPPLLKAQRTRDVGKGSEFVGQSVNFVISFFYVCFVF